MAIAWRNLLQDRIRLGLSIVTVALAITAILLLQGLLGGASVQVSAYLDHAPGTVAVAWQGDETRGGLILPDAIDAVRSVAGVARVVPVIYGEDVLELAGKRQVVAIVGYDPAAGGGPWKLHAGREPAADGEVVLDAALAANRHLGLGAHIDLLGRQLELVGLSEGTSSWTSAYAFVTRSAFAAFRQAPAGAANLLFVTPSAGVSPREVIDRIALLPNLDPRLKSDFIEEQVRPFKLVFFVTLELMGGIAWLVGTLVVGMVVYAATLERRREFGVLKAIGIRNLKLYGVVTVQSLALGIAGCALGVAMATQAARVIAAFKPEFLVVIDANAMAAALGGAVLMAVGAALFPARMLARLAPAEVFRV